MRAFKFTSAGATGMFSRFVWPTPAGAEPGAWVVPAASLAPCAAGVHACELDALVSWLGPELWVIELGGALRREPRKLVAARGRLVARVEGWNEATARALAEASAMRARDLVCEALRAAGDVERARALASASGPDAVAAALGDLGAVPGEMSLAVDYLGDALAYRAADPGASALCAAHAALSEDGFWREREWQSRWLAERLALASYVTPGGAHAGHGPEV